MTQFNPPAPPAPPSAPGGQPGPGITPVHKPWSAAAVTGFVLAMLGVTAPLGVIFGIVGIVKTGGGVRRGRGLAIAAIPVSVVTGSIVFLCVLLVVLWVQGQRRLVDHVQELLAGSVDARRVAADAALAIATDDFRADVDSEELAAWLAGIVEEHGQLVSVGKPRMIPGGGQALALDIPGKFVNGDASIVVWFLPDLLSQFELDDIEVGGSSPRERSSSGP